MYCLSANSGYFLCGPHLWKPSKMETCVPLLLRLQSLQTVSVFSAPVGKLVSRSFSTSRPLPSLWTGGTLTDQINPRDPIKAPNDLIHPLSPPVGLPTMKGWGERVKEGWKGCSAMLTGNISLTHFLVCSSLTYRKIDTACKIGKNDVTTWQIVA